MYQSRATNMPLRESQWGSPPAVPVLADGEVHIWQAGLEEEKTTVLKTFLSDEEWSRAARFRSHRPRNEFIVARGQLRIILAKYLNMPPAQVGFEYSHFGKPSIHGPSRGKIKFNVAHSDGVALYAIARDREIGIDLERIKPFSFDERTVAECLTAEEIRILMSLPSDEGKKFFFECWTRKESYLKACGVGLMSPPNQIETCRISERSAAIWEIEACQAEKQAAWAFQDIPPIPGYASAVVVEGTAARFDYWLFGGKK